jgi:hypothetical protein
LCEHYCQYIHSPFPVARQTKIQAGCYLTLGTQSRWYDMPSLLAIFQTSVDGCRSYSEKPRYILLNGITSSVPRNPTYWTNLLTRPTSQTLWFNRPSHELWTFRDPMSAYMQQLKYYRLNLWGQVFFSDVFVPGYETYWAHLRSRNLLCFLSKKCFLQVEKSHIPINEIFRKLLK